MFYTSNWEETLQVLFLNLVLMVNDMMALASDARFTYISDYQDLS